MKKKFFFLFVWLCLGIGEGKGQFTVLHNFNDTLGGRPYGSLTLLGKKLYGMTSGGGVNNSGCIFSIDTNGANYRDIFDFNGANGSNPEGSLIFSGNKFYGMTLGGGTMDSGCIFCIDTSGLNYKLLHSFNGLKGCIPYGNLAISGEKMFGLTNQGGADSIGCLFSVDTNGNNYKDILDFTPAIGGFPEGTPTLSGPKLFGITNYPGFTANLNYTYSIDTDGNNYKNFGFVLSNPNESAYSGTLTISGTRLFGAIKGGGTHGADNLFSIDTTGHMYKDIYDSWSGGDFYGAMTLSGNKLYGMEYLISTVYSIDTNGNNFTDMLNFNVSNGEFPYGALTLLGRDLYGMALYGGTNDYGVIFKIDTSAVSSINNLSAPSASLTIYPNPSTGIFTIAFSHPELVSGSQTNVEIYNVLGEKVYSQLSIVNSQLSINISNQPSGVYFYRVVKEDGSIVGSGKVVIEK